MIATNDNGPEGPWTDSHNRILKSFYWLKLIGPQQFSIIKFSPEGKILVAACPHPACRSVPA